ncbi:YceI family protein [Aestuariibacter sp. A3R04]|uniref:YceI family protein n=1 Tax=Aestuariibacter sp. A3R04 TaxID=2841571 RepID=UPI001C096E13|nr:YceI family protein [Aestuariibacter sp. A3R04]MBU3020341.1 YceI family protein [Aestuariibacter sp. A3R04]
MIKRALLALSACVALPVSAAWTLDTDASSLNFLTTKNAQVTEVHSFDRLQGNVSDEGKLTVTVPLSSVNTNIDIRDTRMQEMLFETSSYPNATFSATVPDELISMAAGQSKTTSVEGEINLHGVTAPATFQVVVNKLNDNTLTVATTAPTVISASSFKLEGGVKALQDVAKLNSITLAVPVTFSVAFTQ